MLQKKYLCLVYAALLRYLPWIFFSWMSLCFCLCPKSIHNALGILGPEAKLLRGKCFWLFDVRLVRCTPYLLKLISRGDAGHELRRNCFIWASPHLIQRDSKSKGDVSRIFVHSNQCIDDWFQNSLTREVSATLTPIMSLGEPVYENVQKLATKQWFPSNAAPRFFSAKFLSPTFA